MVYTKRYNLYKQTVEAEITVKRALTESGAQAGNLQNAVYQMDR